MECTQRILAIPVLCWLLLSTFSAGMFLSLQDAEGTTGSRSVNDIVAVNQGLIAQGGFTTARFIDLNGDQYLDIVAAYYGDFTGGVEGAKAYTSNNGNSWTAASTGLPQTDNFAKGTIGDVDEDGNDDLIIPHESVNTMGPASGIDIWLSNGGAGGTVSWSAGTSPTNTGSFNVLDAGDIDGDGHLDIVAAPQSGNGLRAWFGDGGTTWTAANVGLPTTGDFMGIGLADINEDSRLDIVGGYGSGIRAYTCNADRSWTQNSSNLPTNIMVYGLTTGDLNNDDNVDILVGVQGGGMRAFIGNGAQGGNMQWTAASTGLPANNDYMSVAIGKVDRDADPDIIGASFWTSGNTGNFGADLFTGNGGAGGTMQWTQVVNNDLPTTRDYFSVDLADFNNDGTEDILLGAASSAWTTGGQGIKAFKVIARLSELPIPDAGADQNVWVDALATLNGSASNDDTRIISFLWNMTSKPAGSIAALNDTAAVRPSFTPDKPGTYTFSLNVKDEHNQWADLEDTVNVIAKVFPNARPQANAGADQTVKIFTLVQLNGSASWDDAQVTAYNWNFTSKPTESMANLSDETVVDPTFTPDFIGSYKFTLTVKDVNNTWSKNDEVVITVNPSGTGAPTADAGPDQTIELGDKAMLNGSASKDDQQIKIYEWALESAPPGVNVALQNIKEQEILPPAVGSYVFILRVRDNDNLWCAQPDSVTVIVLPKDLDPVPKISEPDDKDIFLSTDIITFNGKDSADPEGGDLTYVWTSDLDGELGTTDYFLRNLTIGEHTITLTVKDDHDHVVGTSIHITVKLDDLPVARIEASKALVLKGEKVTLDGAESSDAQGSIAGYMFDYGDKQNTGWVAASTASHMYKSAGVYNATLKVKDGKGQESLLSEPVQIVVGERPNAVLVTDLAVQTAKRPVIIDATGSTDSDGTIVEYYFDLGDGTNTGWTTTGNKTVIYQTPGTYEITVKVRDNHGYESLNTAKVTVTIKAPKKQSNGMGNLMLPLLVIIIVIVAVVVAVALVMRKRGQRAETASPSLPAAPNPVQQPQQAQALPPPPPQNYYAQQTTPYDYQQPQAYESQQYYGQEQGQSYDQSYYQGYDQTGQQYQQPPQNPQQ